MGKANEINSSSAVCQKMQQVSKATDINQIEINTSLPVTERIQHFLSHAGDPYQFKIGDTTVHISFCVEDINLQERLAHMMSEML